MSGPNQSMREFTPENGQWGPYDRGDVYLDLLREEEVFLRELASANELVRLAGEHEARQQPMSLDELQIVYSIRERALRNLLAFRETIVRVRFQSTPMWIVRPTPVIEDLGLARILPGTILRFPSDMINDALPDVAFQQEYLCQPPDIAQGPDQTQVRMPDGSMPRPDVPISSGRRTGDALAGILQLGVDAPSPMRWDSTDIFFTHPPEPRMTGRLDNIDAGEGTYSSDRTPFPPIRPNVEASNLALTMDDIHRGLRAITDIFQAGPERDGVPCDRCAAVVRPGDSYPVIWIGTRSRVALCEGCFRREQKAGRARPCAGLDEEAT